MKPSDWQPIETAPRGKILCWCETDDGGEWFELYKCGEDHIEYQNERLFSVPFWLSPTHWMPIVGPEE